MRHILTATATVIVLAGASPFGQTQQDGPDSAPRPDPFQEAWFVELTSPPLIDGSSATQLDAEADEFHRTAGRAGISYRQSRQFKELWHGLSVEADADSARAMRRLPIVRAVYPVVHAHRVQEDAGGVSTADMETALAATGAHNAQRRLRLTGRRVRVAVMDSGIDYDHPDLGGCFGRGCRVSQGWDFVGDAFNPDRSSQTYDPRPNPDPLPDDCDGHGTHVAGIIGADGVIRGVAPAVEFHAYRVFGCAGPTTTDVMLAAMERAFQDGADILNISIGAPYQWPDYPTAQAADRLVRRGMVVVSSAGNEGSNGLYATAAPGIGRQTIGVASFDNAFNNVAAFTVFPGFQRIGYLPAEGSVAVPLEGFGRMMRTGLPTTADDACAALPAGSLGGRIALIRRGTCSFVAKAANAQAAGAVAIVFYNNAPERITVGVTGGPPITIPVVSISGEDGEDLSERLATRSVKLRWTTKTVQEPVATANLISRFSSYGPTADLAIKPDLGAPGGAIRSTLPLELGAYGSISGTSQAAPYVAGAIALLLEARPHTSPAEALTRFQNTARPKRLSSNPSSGLLELVHRQGAGMISVDQAILTPVTVTPSRLALGEIESGQPAVMRLRVNGGEPVQTGRGLRGVTFRLGHEPAPATGPNTFTPSILAAFATVTFDAPTVRGGGEIVARITRPSDAAADLFGGYITLTPDDDGPVLRVPYLGYSGDYQSIRALTPTSADFPWLAKVTGGSITRQRDGGTFTMGGSDQPVILFHLEHQVRALQAKVVDNATGVTLGLVTSQEFVGRNSAPVAFFSFTWTGTYTPLSGGAPAPAPNGSYRLELSVLKARGNPDMPEHVETWISPPIVIARTAVSPTPTP